MIYKALSIKQPWAALLAHGRKTIEVRRWSTRHRGTLLIHAAGIPDPRPHAWAQVPPELREAARQMGGVVGVGRLDSCKKYATFDAFVGDQSRHLNNPDWFEAGRLFGLCFLDLCVLPFHQVPGYVKLFEVSLDDLEMPLAASESGSRVHGLEEDHGPLAAVLQRFPWLKGIVARTLQKSQPRETDNPTE